MKIRDRVQVVAQPTVIRLDHLHGPDAKWISESYYITEETRKYFKSLRSVLSRETGCGMFVIGHYGSGKSHFLAYLTQQLRSGAIASGRCDVVPLSLLNHKAAQSLESIIGEVLGIDPAERNRSRAWKKVCDRHASGLFLVIDELSEFLRSKPDVRSFNEDLRFLQFLGEWADGHRFWILAALQEQIEHTGEIEYDLYRKIKDRYPLRFLLTPTHVRDLISHRILVKGASYGPEMGALAKGLRDLYPEGSVDYAALCELYPLHPATMELLEEVRDRFSQARGIVDFTLTQMLGSEAKGVEPFLDRPWGEFITPDTIVDHFADLFEIQPEFLAVAQRVLPHFRKRIPEFFENPAQQSLAWRLLKLLILVHLSPRRRWLSLDQAAQWLLLAVSRVDPEKNQAILKRILDSLVDRGAFLKRQGSRYCLDIEDSSREDLEEALSRTADEIKGSGDAIFESLIPLLEGADFNPFTLPRERWHNRTIRWHFHDREIPVYLGGGVPEERGEPALQIGIPWGPAAEGHRCYRIQPRRLEPTPEILELAALCRMRERPLHARLLGRVGELIARRSGSFRSLVRAAYSEGAVLNSAGAKVSPPLVSLEKHGSWLQAYGEWVLRQTYPMFERFAPGHGPLPRDLLRQFMKHAEEQDLGGETAPDAVRLIREAYLVPMGLMQRHGADYRLIPRLENHDLVRLLAPLVEHHPAPDRIYEHLGAPPYGLVADQIQLLLMFLVIHGEIDIVKGDRSYREFYDTLTNPLQYDKVLPGRALTLPQIHDLESLCEGFRVQVPKQWTVLAQKRAIVQLQRVGGRQRGLIGDLVLKLKSEPDTVELQARLERLISQWLALEKGKNELQGLQQFLFEIGSVSRFLAECDAAAWWLDRFDHLIRETRRFRHLFGYPVLADCRDAAIATAIEALGGPPPLAQPEDLEMWQDRARSVYEQYQHWYRGRHAEWFRASEGHPIWSYSVPAVARTRHIGLAPLIRDLEATQAQARAERCLGVSSLEFQPVCRCGFDGSDSPLNETLRRFDILSGRLENEVALFFQQEKVKSRVREWIDQKIEMNTRTLSYLDGKESRPEIENVTLFDQHLAGLELVKRFDADSLLDLIGERTWDRTELMRALGEFFERVGPRVALRREAMAPREGLIAWCCEQALKHGVAVPAALSAQEQSLVTRVIQPEWVGEESLRNLECLGLREDAIQRILQMLLDGTVRAPERPPASGPVAAACEMLNPRAPVSAADLAATTANLYTQNARFLHLRPREWLARLQELAGARLPEPPPALDQALRSRLDAQWIVVDCLGLPLLGAARRAIEENLHHWSLGTIDFALAPTASTTDGFYRSLADGGVMHSFEKIDAIDDLIHSRQLDFGELLRLAQAELEIALRRSVVRLDTSRAVCVFGDHGFRLAADGRSFTHGGQSMLERIIPILSLSPLARSG